ncbi:MAG: asparagine synthase-related protein [Phycisphaerae bacterium]
MRVLQTFADFEEASPTTAEVVDRFEEVMSRVMRDIAHLDLRAANLLSGGVDSSLVQIYWNKAIAGSGVRPPSVEVVVSHPRTEGDHEYARSMAKLLGTTHHTVTAGKAYAESLQAQIRTTGEPPNHVQSAYVIQLAQFMRSNGLRAGLCGEGADSLFGTDWSAILARAGRLQRLSDARILGVCLSVLATLLRKPDWRDVFRLLGYSSDYTSVHHPSNRIAVFTDMALLHLCFQPDQLSDAFAARRNLANEQLDGDTFRLVDLTGFVGEALQTGSLWAALCESEGVRLYCPYLDSRILRIGINLRGEFRYRQGQTKWVLKSALARYVPEEFVRRPKRGFGQPIFEWLFEGGQLRAFAEQIADYDFVPRRVREQALAKPTWFLYSLLCYDIWHKTFVANRKNMPGTK